MITSVTFSRWGKSSSLFRDALAFSRGFPQTPTDSSIFLENRCKSVAQLGCAAQRTGIRFKLVTTTTEMCPICGGTGWQTVERGKEREAVRCECRVKDRGERLLAAARIPPRYQHCELANFRSDPDDQKNQSICHARLLAGRFVEEYPLQKE